MKLADFGIGRFIQLTDNNQPTKLKKQSTLKSGLQFTDAKHTPLWAPPEWRDTRIKKLTADESLLPGDIFSFCLVCFDLLTRGKYRPQFFEGANYGLMAIIELENVKRFLLEQKIEQDEQEVKVSDEEVFAKKRQEREEKEKRIKKTFGKNGSQWIEILLEGLERREENINWFVEKLTSLYNEVC